MALVTHRGVYLPSLKKPASGRPIEEMTVLSRAYLPVALRGETRPVLSRYTSVLQGQVIARPVKSEGVPLLSSVSGVYTEEKTLSHPIYGEIDCLVMDCMEIRRPTPPAPQSTDKLTPAQILDIARQQAVVDELDGRFVAEKLQEWAAEGCDILVGDGVEDQPYACAAWGVLNESVEQVYEGLKLAARALGVEEYHLSVQPLPGDHRRALRQRLGDDKKLFIVRGKYPAQCYTKKPFGKTVRRIGVQALLALWRAAALGEPHTTCVVTVAGDAVATPRNLRVPFGTPATELFRLCGLAADPTLLLFGDMMTGQAVSDPDTPILPGVTCLLALCQPDRPVDGVCVGCGRCVQVCHAGLMPEAILQLCEKGATDQLAPLHPEDCDGCGACSAV
ncbi:MAG: hypothetical protein J6R77_06795, partial [Clostridia bacterium]|nr:hypothetical protein [Clostridia bacterium]